MSNRTKIFISYSHDDERWRKRLVGHLAVLATEGILDMWDDRQLGAGDDWHARIHEQMNSARIAVLLISSSFLTSKFIREEEVPKLFDRHEQEGMMVYPLLVKPCLWQEVDWLARMQLRPPEARPLASFKGAKVDEVLVEVAREISAIARGQAQGTSQPAASRPEVSPAAPDIAGRWQAEVTYDWPNAKYTEAFNFQVDADEVLGTACYLAAERAIWNGKLTGNKLTFVTKTQVLTFGTDWKNHRAEREEREEVHHYRGKISQDEIRFSMQTEGGFSSHVPIEFTARRVGPIR
jgi:hypothetical protein